jgi:hypothetical protein
MGRRVVSAVIAVLQATHFNPLFTTPANYICTQCRRSTYFWLRNKGLREKYNNRISLKK